MSTGLRVRVTWDDTVIEDRVHHRRQLLIGSGPRANVVVPGEHGRYAMVTIRGTTIELRIAPRTVASIEFPGEDPVDAAALDEPLVRALKPPFGSALLRVGGALVELERYAGRDKPARDRGLVAIAAAAAVLALLAGGSYRLVRLFGDGARPQWGRPPSLSERDASRVRVRIGPDGAGASRPQAGLGAALKGRREGSPGSTPPTEIVDVVERPAVAGRKKPPAIPGQQPRGDDPDESGAARLAAAKKQPPAGPRLSRERTLDEAQAALLAADLRKAADSFSRAAKEGPLDYDQLNWLGLAHYLAGDYGDANREWERARSFDAMRADAINNLASVAKRRGDTTLELTLLHAALEREPHDCHASNSLALALAKQSKLDEAEAMLAESDGWCGGGYAYTNIQRAAIKALSGHRELAFQELEAGLKRVDTLIPVKEFEVLADLRLDPAFASLRSEARFAELVRQYLPRAAQSQPL